MLFRVVITLVLIACTTTGASFTSRKLLGGDCAAPYRQCGGEICPADSSVCSDAAYACCPSGYGCQRLTQLYWQCLPNIQRTGDDAPSVSAAGTAQTPPFPNIVTPRQALHEHIQFPDYQAALAAGQVSEE